MAMVMVEQKEMTEPEKFTPEWFKIQLEAFEAAGSRFDYFLCLEHCLGVFKSYHDKCKELESKLTYKPTKSPRIEPKDCFHKELTFGSGGFYVICNECGTFWQHLKGINDPDFNGNKVEFMKDLRVAPLCIEE